MAAARDRMLLCLLLLHANRVVTLDEVIDTLWAQEPPPTARGQVHGCVFRLRRLLEGAVLHTRPPGYVLSVTDDELDALLFERMVGQGRAAVIDGRLAAGVRLLRQALGLWRGPAFAAMDSPAVLAEAARLDELHLAAWEDCIDVMLRLGAGRDLVAELTALTAQHPLRERFRQQLMVALYRADRQGDALAAYRQAREYLAEALGVAPSPELDQTHARILRQDRGLDASAGVGTAALPAAVVSSAVAVAEPAVAVAEPLVVAAPLGPAVRPAQLPMDVPGFAGREHELAALSTLLPELRTEHSTIICAITGTAGVGKTTLAVHWAHRVSSLFPDGQLYVNLRGFDPSGSALSPDEAIWTFLDALGVPPERTPAGLAARTAVYRSLLAGRRMLVVVDNARDVDQVRPLLPGLAGCLVLVTSRNQLTGLLATECARLLALDVLSVAESRKLLTHRLGTARAAAEPDAVDDIAASCAGLPLALAIAAARAAARAEFPLGVLAAELRDTGRGLDALDCHDDATGVRAMFSWSYHRLSTDAACLFRLLGLHPGPHISAAAAASVAGAPVKAVRRQLAELVGAHMITERSPGAYGFHDLLRAYATELAHDLDSERLRRRVTRRMLDHYLHTAWEADLILDPHRTTIVVAPPQRGVTLEELSGPQQALAWFSATQPILVSLIRQAAAAGFGTHSWQLSWAQADYLYWRGHWHDLRDISDAALRAARQSGSLVGQAHAHRGLAGAATSLGRHEQARWHLEQALQLFGDSGSSADQAHIHRNMALVLEKQGRYADALGHACRSSELYGAGGDLIGEARALSNIGRLRSLQGDPEGALDCCSRALTLLSDCDDGRGEADAWDNLGWIHYRIGDYQRAAICYQRAIDLLGENGDRSSQVTALAKLGDAYHAVADTDAARLAWRQALSMMDSKPSSPGAEELRAKLRLTGAVASGDGCMP